MRIFKNFKMKITEDNIIQLKNYWGNRTTKDIIPLEMKITVSDVREWFNGFLNENGKHFKTGKIFYKTKGLTNFNRRVGIGFVTYYPYLWMDYGRKGFETVRVKSIISENGEIFFNLSKYNLCGDKKISLTDYYNHCNHLTNECAQSDKHSCGKTLNADINGAIGILRKGNAITDEQLMLLRDRGDVVSPKVFRLNF